MEIIQVQGYLDKDITAEPQAAGLAVVVVVKVNKVIQMVLPMVVMALMLGLHGQQLLLLGLVVITPEEVAAVINTQHLINPEELAVEDEAVMALHMLSQ
jgi:hypothetical protein